MESIFRMCDSSSSPYEYVKHLVFPLAVDLMSTNQCSDYLQISVSNTPEGYITLRGVAVLSKGLYKGFIGVTSR